MARSKDEDAAIDTGSQIGTYCLKITFAYGTFGRFKVNTNLLAKKTDT